jgi:hypothetical protein
MAAPTTERGLLIRPQGAMHRSPGSVRLATAFALFYGVTALTLLWFVPKCEQMFRDYGVALPMATWWVIQVSNWALGRNVGQAMPGVVVLLVVAGPVIAGTMLLPWLGRTARRVGWLVLVMMILALIAALASLLVPMITMSQAVEQQAV